MGDWLGDCVDDVMRAERLLAAAESAWDEASRAYGAAYHRSQRHVLDEWGCRTGEFEELTALEAAELDRLYEAEEAAYRLRQRAKDRLDSAERVLSGGLP